MRPDLTFVLRGGNASSFESALHELIHLRIAIDRVLPEDQRSSFFGEYNQLIEMTEVMSTAKFGAGSTLGDKSSYGALPLAAGTWEKVIVVLNKMEVICNFFINQDANAEAAFDKEPLLTPAALVEFILQEKYVTQAAARATSRSGSPRQRHGGHALCGHGRFPFPGFVSAEAQERIAKSPVGSRLLRDATDSLRVSMKALYDELDQLLPREEAKNPPTPPATMPDPIMFQWRPLGLDGQSIPPAPAKLPEYGLGRVVSGAAPWTPFRYGTESQCDTVAGIMPELRIVLDTNVLVSAFRSQRGPAYRLVSLIGRGRFALSISVPLVFEYEDVLGRATGLEEADIARVLRYICSVAWHQRIFFLWRPLLPDPKDDLILELAVASRSSCIVTYNQRDFMKADLFGIEVVTPEELLGRIGE